MMAKRGADRRLPHAPRIACLCGHQAGIVQLFSSRVGAITSRLWFAAGTGARQREEVPLVLDLAPPA